MELIKFIMWLTAGAVTGWFANQMVTTEHRWTREPIAVEASKTEET